MRSPRNGLWAIWRENWLFLLVVGGLVLAFLPLRTPRSAVRSVSEVDSLLRSGHPTLIEFYSNT